MPHTNVPRSSCGGGYETGTATTCATRPAASTSSHSFLPLADRDDTSRRSPGRPASQKSKMPWLPGFFPVEIDIQAGELYGGVIAVVSLMFLINRRYGELATFLLASVVVAWLVFSPDQVASAARSIGNQIF